MTGWIKLHRELLDWEWYDHIPTKTLFLHLLLKSNHAPTRYRGHEIKAGASVTGLNALSIQTGLSVQQVRTALKNLQSTNEITNETTNNFSIISIVKWHEYQSEKQTNNNQITNGQQTDNKQSTTSKELNNKKNEKNKEKEIVIPDFINGDLWIEWIQHRKEIKKSLTPTQSKKQINQLTAWNAAGHDVNKIISDSIQNGWQGLFKPKGENNGKQTRSADLAEQARKLMEQYPD